MMTESIHRKYVKFLRDIGVVKDAKVTMLRKGDMVMFFQRERGEGRVVAIENTLKKEDHIKDNKLHTD